MPLNGAQAPLAGEPTRVIAIRHGETQWNAFSRVQGQLDVPLNERGRWQARRAALALADESFASIYASDLARAHETALIVAKASGATVVSDAGLRERGFGIFEGHTFDQIEQRWPAESQRWRKREVDFGPEGGERLDAFYVRCIATASRLAAAHAGHTIALVAHGGVLDCLYRAAARIELHRPRTWQLGNASINRLLFTPQGFTLVGWSDTSHLDSTSTEDLNDQPASAQRA
jgi:probable phosphoglycerate mutase